jgi:hypothetical protein
MWTYKSTKSKEKAKIKISLYLMVSCFSRAKSLEKADLIKENYKNKSNLYLKNKIEKLEVEKNRERCYCCLYSTGAITSLFTSLLTTGVSSSISIPSTIITVVSAKKSNDKLEEIIFKRKIILEILDEKINLI